MQTPLRLSWRNVMASDAIEAEVRQEAERLERFCGRITGCAVTIEAPSRHHRQSGSQYRVRIDLTVPGAHLVVGRDPRATRLHGDVYAAVKAAFREAQRQLTDRVARLEGRVKAHEGPARAVVARIFPQEGYGFLTTREGREIYFHENSVVDGGFGRLEAGCEVRFVEAPGMEGPQASTVERVGHERAPA